MDSLSTSSDGALIILVAKGNQDALGEIYRRYGGLIMAVARRVLHDTASSEEVVQDVFIKLWDAPERFDPDRGTLRAFLAVQAHSRAVDIVRQRQSRAAREELFGRTQPMTYDLDRELTNMADAERINVAMASIPMRERQAIELAYFEGKTYRQVAAQLGESEGTTKSRIRFGLKRLRAAMEYVEVDNA